MTATIAQGTNLAVAVATTFGTALPTKIMKIDTTTDFLYIYSENVADEGEYTIILTSSLNDGYNQAQNLA
jgi:hypothetical protein